MIRYQAFADYWKGKQTIDDLIFAITADPAVRQQKLMAGECDIIPYPNPADIEALKADADLTVMQQEGLNVGYLAYNTQQAPFDKPEVRKALNMAINKQAIIEAVFQGPARRRSTRSRRLLGATTPTWSTTPTIRRRPRPSSRRPASRTSR